MLSIKNLKDIRNGKKLRCKHIDDKCVEYVDDKTLTFESLNNIYSGNISFKDIIQFLLFDERAENDIRARRSRDIVLDALKNKKTDLVCILHEIELLCCEFGKILKRNIIDDNNLIIKDFVETEIGLSYITKEFLSKVPGIDLNKVNIEIVKSDKNDYSIVMSTE